MPQDKDLKRLVRARMAQAGERYTQALTHVLSRTRLDPLPAPWFLTGSRAPDYEVGLLPGTRDGHRVVQLRLRSADILARLRTVGLPEFSGDGPLRSPAARGCVWQCAAGG